MDFATFIGLFAAVVATWVAVSGPGEAALVGAAVMAARGDVPIAIVVAVAFAGTIAGSVVAYWLGRAGGRRLLLRPGPFLAWRVRALARTEAMAKQRAFLASMLTPGWFAGVSEIPARPFVAGTALSGLLWALTIGLGTFYVGPSLVSLYDDVGGWLLIGAGGLAVGVALLRSRGVSFRWRRSRRQPI